MSNFERKMKRKKKESADNNPAVVQGCYPKEGEVSVCMIVKNEEALLANCLESIKWVDELIVVDTGSTDKTVEIAESFGADLHFQEWQDDFSLHRNYSQSFATKPWILVIDADAELCFRHGITPEVLKRDLAKFPQNIGAVCCDAEDYQKGVCTMQYKPVRLFRNQPGFCWKRRVHNKPHFDGKVGYHDGIFVKHYGYDLSPERMKAKSDRMVRLLKEAILENPQQWENYFYLNQAYNLRDDYERSLWAGEKYIAAKNEIVRFNPTVYYTCFKCAFAVRDKERAEKFLKQGLEHFPKDLDLCVCQVELGAWKGDLALVEIGAQTFLEEYYKIHRGVHQKGSFCFTDKPESLAYVLYALMMAKFQLGVNQMSNLKNVLPLLNDTMRGSFLAKVGKDLAGLGLESLDFTKNKKDMEDIKSVSEDPTKQLKIETV